MSKLQVRAMTEAEFDEWRLTIARAYADERVKSGNWAPEEALGLALAGNANLLPQGLATEGMLLLTALRPDGAPVGRVWLGLEHPRGTADCAFLYDIEVDQPHRGQGYGRALLAAAEDAVPIARRFRLGAERLRRQRNRHRALSDRWLRRRPAADAHHSHLNTRSAAPSPVGTTVPWE
jgi:GNAT superfamily N-acetyltransferase